MLFDPDNLVGIDAEWRPGYDYVLLCLNGKINGKSTQKTIDMTKNPEAIDKFIGVDAVYYVSPLDIVAARKVAPCRSYADVAILCSAAYNPSRYKEQKGGTSLGDRVFKYLGHGLSHKMKPDDWTTLSQEPKFNKWFWDRLKSHCMEDATSAYRLATFLNQTIDLDKQRFTEWNEFAQRWIPILQQGTPMNPKIMAFMRDKPEEFTSKVISACQSIGCDAFHFDKGLHMNLKKMQDFYEATKPIFEWIEIPSTAAWADGRIFHTDRKVWYEFSRSGTEQQKHIAGIIYSALLLWYFQQNRFEWRDNIDHLEVVFGQQSGRASAVHHPINSGGFFRAAVKPLPGECIVSLDISSQEPRISAWLSKDPELLKATSGDVYWEFARTLDPSLPENLSASERKAHPARSRVKPIVLAFCYGGGYHVFAKKLQCSAAQAKFIEKRLNERFCTFKSFCLDVERWGRLMGFVETRIHKFPLLVDKYSNPRQIVNHVVQGTAADLLRLCVRDLQDADFNIFATMFDGVYLRMSIADAKTGEIEAACKLMERTLTTNYEIHVPWRVEPAIDQWHLAKTGEIRPYFTDGVFEKPEYVGLIKALGMESLI